MNNSSVKTYPLLTPFAFLYGLIIYLRNKLFDWKILPSEEFDIPIISVGNITVGGTGKTPHIEYLIGLLSPKYRVAVLSRGYKRKTRNFVLSTTGSTAKEIGDEPYQIKRKFPDIVVAVDKNRRRGIRNMLKINPPVDIILLDDAFQHRYVTPSTSILLTDIHRLIHEDSLLPVGRLREPAFQHYRAQIIVVTKCPEDIKPIDFRIIQKLLNPYPYQDLFFSSFAYGDLVPVFPESVKMEQKSDDRVKNKNILLVTGIASPKAIEEYLRQYTDKIQLVTFDDHHNFTKNDIKLIEANWNKTNNKGCIIITEKDAARLFNRHDIPEKLKEAMYYLPIKVHFLKDQTNTFNTKILDYVRKNKRNSRIPQ